jgi:hypothetical protein
LIASVSAPGTGGPVSPCNASSSSSSSSSSNSNNSAVENRLNCSSYETGIDYNGFDVATAGPAADQADCCAQCGAMANCSFYSFCTPPGCPTNTCYFKSSNQDRVARSDRQSGPVKPPSPPSQSFTLAPCPSHYDQPGYDVLDDKGTYYAYNLLYELDQEGEFYVNRTSGMLYFWPPATSSSAALSSTANASSAYWTTAPWGLSVVSQVRDPLPIQRARTSQLQEQQQQQQQQRRWRRQQARLGGGDGDGDDAVVGEISVDDDLMVYTGTQYLSLDGLVLTTARNAAVRAVNASFLSVSNCVLQNTGSMVVNVTGGRNFTLEASAVRHGGNGAVFLCVGRGTVFVFQTLFKCIVHPQRSNSAALKAPVIDTYRAAMTK